jgi:hypothetical protein
MSGFITRWVVAGDATARTITLPLYNSGVFNCTVDWGDGGATSAITAYDDADRVHTYASDGTYDVTITGECPAWSFTNAGDKLKIVSILNWGTVGDFGGFQYLTEGFDGCTNLTNIGVTGKILAKAGLANLYRTFRSCKISTIPAGLLDNCVNLASNGIYDTFIFCTSLTTIPTDLFKYCVSINSCAFAFFGCTALVTVPTDLFRYNTAIISVSYCFSGCTALASIPTNLFKYNTSCTSFLSCFEGCNKLSLNKNIFYAEGEQGTRFLNRTVDFTGCFTRTSFTGAQGTAPDIWACNFGTGAPTGMATCFSGAGNTLTSIANYCDVPTTWGATSYCANLNSFGSWEWYQKKTNAGSIRFSFASAQSGFGGYAVLTGSDETINVVQSGYGSTIITGGSVTHSVWYKIKVTRTPAGLFSLWINDVLIGTGTNTVFSKTDYLVIDADAGDQIAYSDSQGNHSIVKKPLA